MLFRSESGLDPRIRIQVGQADIDMDGVPEVFATGREDDCEKWGCYTGVYKKVDGNWVEVEGLSAFFGNDDDPLIYIREEVVDGMRTLYSSRHEPLADPGPDQRVVFGTANEVFSSEDWVESYLSGFDRGPENYWFGRFDMNDDGIDEIFATRIPDGDCGVWFCVTGVQVKWGDEWFSPNAFELPFNAMIGDDGLPEIYVRDEWKDGYRTYYTSLDGPRERVPFPDPE